MDAEPSLGAGARRLLADSRAVALDRFPTERTTLLVFFDELAARLEAEGHSGPPKDPGASFAALLRRLEEYLEALLVGEAHGLARR